MRSEQEIRECLDNARKEFEKDGNLDKVYYTLEGVIGILEWVLGDEK